jgi:hypothetical protein
MYYIIAKLPVRCYGFFVCFLVMRATRPFSSAPFPPHQQHRAALASPSSNSPIHHLVRRSVGLHLVPPSSRTCRYAHRSVLAQGTSGLHPVALDRGHSGLHNALPSSSPQNLTNAKFYGHLNKSGAIKVEK